MSHFAGTEKLRRAIWCKIFVVQEGYILYLKIWSQKSLESRVKQLQEEDEVHSDIQRLDPGSSLDKHSESLEVANSAVGDKPLKLELASHQKKLARKCNQEVMTGIQENN